MGQIVATHTKPQLGSLVFWPDRKDFVLRNKITEPTIPTPRY